MVEIAATLAKYGLLGVLLILSIIWIVKKEKDHERERLEWKALSEKQFDNISELTKDTASKYEQTAAKQIELMIAIKTMLEGR